MKTWIALLSATALLLAGCGGGSEGTSSVATTSASGGALTKAELIEQGDAICTKVYVVTEALNPEGTTKDALRFADLHSGMVKSLLRLGVPQETEYSYAEYTTAAHAFAQAEAEVKTMVKRGDPAALRRAESGSLSALSMFQGLSAAYGFKECAEGAA
jgi:hypothetical protein